MSEEVSLLGRCGRRLMNRLLAELPGPERRVTPDQEAALGRLLGPGGGDCLTQFPLLESPGYSGTGPELMAALGLTLLGLEQDVILYVPDLGWVWHMMDLIRTMSPGMGRGCQLQLWKWTGIANFSYGAQGPRYLLRVRVGRPWELAETRSDFGLGAVMRGDTWLISTVSGQTGGRDGRSDRR